MYQDYSEREREVQMTRAVVSAIIPITLFTNRKCDVTYQINSENVNISTQLATPTKKLETIKYNQICRFYNIIPLRFLFL